MKDKRTTAEYQRNLDAFVRREVGHCVSTLVGELSQQADAFPDYYDDLSRAYYGEPDYETAARDNGWEVSADDRFFLDESLEDNHQYYLSVNLNERGYIAVSVHHCSEPGQGANAPVVWQFNGLADESYNWDGSESLDITNPGELLEYLTEQGILDNFAQLSANPDCNFTASDADDWRELCELEMIDADDYRPNISEHWIVSDWLARKLSDRGELILLDFFGLTVWGRATTGQSISLDSVICDIYDSTQLPLLDAVAN